ncbi:MAG: D-glycerate dehydrogenase [Candidatus Eremiobacteraeota bacterium]|nr:D-glycerate dehydrogenase [Candidatus Eremiobacteraeota bacterium]
MAKIVVAAPVPDAALARLRPLAAVVDVSELPREAWDGELRDAVGLLVSSGTAVDAALLAAAPSLRIIATWSVGYDNIDVAALRARGIVLTNARGTLDEAVADTAWWLVMAAVRRYWRAARWVQSGRWAHGDPPHGRDLRDATLGIVGFGAIGAALARRAKASSMRVIYANRRPRDDDRETGASYRPLDALLAESDCVVLLVPLTPETRGFFGEAAFARMKRDAVLVNVARGAVVDTAALLRALDAGTIAGAALDVTDPEPLPSDDPLLNRDDILITPHIGSASVETRTRMALNAAENLAAYLENRALLTPVAL